MAHREVRHQFQRLTKSPGAILNSRRLARRVEGRMPGIKMTCVVPSRYGVLRSVEPRRRDHPAYW